MCKFIKGRILESFIFLVSLRVPSWPRNLKSKLISTCFDIALANCCCLSPPWEETLASFFFKNNTKKAKEQKFLTVDACIVLYCIEQAKTIDKKSSLES